MMRFHSSSQLFCASILMHSTKWLNCDVTCVCRMTLTFAENMNLFSCDFVIVHKKKWKDFLINSPNIVFSGEQMLNTRRNDALFYDKITDPIVKQIIDNYSSANLICDTTRLTSVPENIFHVPSEKYENHLQHLSTDKFHWFLISRFNYRNPLVYCMNE